MEKGGLTIQPWENENMSRIFCFSKYRVFKRTHVLLGNSTLKVAKLTKFFLHKNFLSYYLLHILCSKGVDEK